MSLGWTTRDLDIVETLTRRVRLLTVQQVACIWWPSTSHVRIVRRRLRRLTGAGLLHRTIVNIHPLLRLKRPLFSWSPGNGEPDFEEVSTRARTRWGRPGTPAEVYWASPVAANLLGSTAGKFPELSHRDHDLLLSQVYVLYRRDRPAEARQWTGEDALGKAGYRIKDPDAFLMDERKTRLLVIESAGRYSAKQIKSFHQHCVENKLPYELW